jgi:hypothetical protein
VQGSGLLLLSSFGAIHAKALGSGEEYIVDTGHIVAFEGTVQWQIEKATGTTQGVGGFVPFLMPVSRTGAARNFSSSDRNVREVRGGCARFQEYGLRTMAVGAVQTGRSIPVDRLDAHRKS